MLQYPAENWPLSADIRRHLTTEYSHPRRDMWSELAEAVVKSGANRVVEFGTSSGYIIRKLLEHGFEGEIVGVEKEDSYLFIAEEIINSSFPDTKATVRLIQGDAQQVTLDDLGGEPFDAGIAANLLYHVPAPKLVFKRMNEAVKDKGIQFFSTKDVEHQAEVWMFANQLAHLIGAEPIHSFYWHFPTSQLDQSLKESKRYTPLQDLRGEHVSETWIPDDEEGWHDFKMTVLTLVPIMELRATGQAPDIHQCMEVMDSDSMRNYLFSRSAENSGGYFKGQVSMSWRAAVNNKPGLE